MTRKGLLPEIGNRLGTYLLLTMLVCLLPPAVVWEYAVSMESWESWEERRTGGWNEDWYTIDSPTPGVIVANAVFRVVVLPPALLFESGSYKTSYGFLALNAAPWGRGGSFHHDPPPTLQALEWWKYAVPFWFVAIAATGESARWLRRRWLHA